jgi:hypothetical protein
MRLLKHSFGIPKMRFLLRFYNNSRLAHLALSVLQKIAESASAILILVVVDWRLNWLAIVPGHA